MVASAGTLIAVAVAASAAPWARRACARRTVVMVRDLNMTINNPQVPELGVCCGAGGRESNSSSEFENQRASRLMWCLYQQQ